MKKEGLFVAPHFNRHLAMPFDILFLGPFFLALLLTSCSSSNLGPQSGSTPTAILSIPQTQEYAFGSQLLDSNTTTTFTVTNLGAAAATSIQGGFTTTAFNFTGGQFPGTNATCTDLLAAGASCTISVTFSPQFYQAFQDAVRLSYFDGVQTQATQNPILTGQGSFGQTGTLDTTLAGTGAIALGSGTENGNAVLVQPDRNIVVVGSTGSGSLSNFLVARYTPDGALDPSFGNLGTVTTDFYSEADVATAAVLQPDGKIVAVGSVQTSTSIQFGVARYLPSGALDISFGNLGRLAFGIGTSNSGATAVAIDTSGNLVVAGYAFSGTTQVFALTRVLPNGVIDSGFGSSGMTITQLGSGNAYATSVNIDTAGHILTTGYALNGTGNDMMSVRYDTTGTVDTTYGTSGISIIDFGTGTDNRAYQAVVVPNGQLIMAGSTTLSGATNSALVRLLVDGTTDNTFGTNGQVILSLSTTADIRGLASGSSGPIYAAGTLYGTSSNTMVVSRLLWNGTLDNTFGTDGSAEVNLSSGSDTTYGLATQTNGKILLVGDMLVSGGTYAGLIRMWP
jgi:uncharacterized delta-60 repeat protein